MKILRENIRNSSITDSQIVSLDSPHCVSCLSCVSRSIHHYQDLPLLGLIDLVAEFSCSAQQTLNTNGTSLHRLAVALAN